MKKRIFILGGLFLLGLWSPLFSQWARTFGGRYEDKAYSVHAIRDGGCIIVGSMESADRNGQDVWALKINPAGEIVWQKTYGDWYEDEGRAVEPTEDNGFVIAGWIDHGGFGYGPPDIWMTKINAQGDIEWQRFQGDTHPHYHAHSRALAFTHTQDGGFIAVGDIKHSYPWADKFNYDLCAAKISADGKWRWQKWCGSAQDEHAHAVRVTSAGDFLVAGSMESGGSQDLWLLKLNPEGDIIWQKTFGGNDDDYAQALQITRDGGFVVAGVTSSFGAGDDDYWVLKFDAGGNIEWQKTYGGIRDDYAHDLITTNDGGFLIVGGSRSFGAGNLDFWVLKLDSEGKVMWEKAYGGSDYESAFSVYRAYSGGYYIIGHTESFGAGGKDILLLRVTFNGDISPSCESFIRDTTATVKTSTASPKTTTLSLSGSMFEYGESFISPRVSTAAAFSICEDTGPFTLKMAASSGGTTNPAPGTYTFPAKTRITIRAIPSQNHRFSGWIGDIPGGYEQHDTLQISFDTDKYIKANFIRQYALNLTTSQGGTTNPKPGISRWDAGSHVSILALPHTHYTFSNWSGNIPIGTGHLNPIDIVMNVNKSLRGDFIRNIYPPVNFTAEQVTNRSLSQIEHINSLAWQPNPDNAGISKYRIYQLVNGTESLLAEIDATQTRYWHRNVIPDRTMVYAVAAVDGQGREGNSVLAVLQ